MELKTREEIKQIAQGMDLTQIKWRGVLAEGQEDGYCPHCGIHLSNGVSVHEPSEGYKNDTNEFACMACGGEWGPLLRKVNRNTNAGKKGKRNAVSVKKFLQISMQTGNIMTYEQVLFWVTESGRTETTLKIQSKALGYKFKEG